MGQGYMGKEERKMRKGSENKKGDTENGRKGERKTCYKS